MFLYNLLNSIQIFISKILAKLLETYTDSEYFTKMLQKFENYQQVHF